MAKTKKGPGGWPAKTGKKSGTGRDNNPPKPKTGKKGNNS